MQIKPVLLWLFGACCTPILAQSSAAPELWQQLARAQSPQDSLLAYTALLRHYAPLSADTARNLATITETLANKRGKKDDVHAEALFRAGIVYHRNAQMPQAKALIIRAISIHEKNKNTIKIAEAYNSLATIEGMTGNMPQATDYLVRALTMTENLPHSAEKEKVIGMTLNNLAGVYYVLKDYENALRYMKKAMVHDKKSNFNSPLPTIYITIGRCYAALGQEDSAYYYFNEGLNEPAINEDNQNLAYALLSLGDLQQDQGKIAEAIETYKKVLNISFINPSRQATLLDNLARSYLLTEKYTESKKFVDEAIRLGEKYNFKDVLSNANGTLYLYYKHFNQFEKALYHHEQMLMYRDSVAGEDKKIATIRQETDYLLQKKQRELAQTTQRQRAQEAQARQQQRYLIVAVLGLLAMAVLSFFLLHTLRLKRRANEALSAQKTLLEQQKAETEQQIARAEQLNKIKDRLLSVMAHDMRSPFSSLQGLLPLIESGALSPEKSRTVLAQLNKLTQTTANMMEDVLLWANAELRGGPAHADLLYPADLALEVVAFLEEPARKKHLHLVMDIPATQKCYGNMGDVRLILRNLVSNAVKFTPEGGKVRIFSAIEGDMLQISVQDTGTGMSHEQINRLLKAEFVTSMPGTAGEKGTGLGLMLCMEFVQRNGGEMRIASEVGQGSTFSFSLPMHLAQIS